MQADGRQLGGLDILVNNAGEQHPDEDIRDITEDQLKRTFQTNIFGMFFLTQAALPHLKKGSAIINCTSVTMYKGSPQLLDYSATKGAITAFTRSLAKNLVEKGIRVNGVAPGPIWTPLNPFGGQKPEEIPEFGKDTPMGRPGQPNEVAPAFLFLACEDSSYMIGRFSTPTAATSLPADRKRRYRYSVCPIPDSPAGSGLVKIPNFRRISPRFEPRPCGVIEKNDFFNLARPLH